MRKRARLALHKQFNLSRDKQDAESIAADRRIPSSRDNTGVADCRLDKPQEDGNEL